MVSVVEHTKPRILAAVDLGSNSFHMVVARYEQGHLTLLDRLREMVQLAKGLDDKHILSEEVQERALACLSRFGERLDSLHPNDVVAVGTNTLRKAKNTDKFLQRASERLGHPIDIISGLEEARLVYIGAAHSVPPSKHRRLVVDIGGGSTELIVGKHFETQRMYSLFMGCVSISKRYFSDGKINRPAIKKARLAVDLEISPVVEPLKKLGWNRAFGTSGTIRSIARLLTEIDPSHVTITPDGLAQLYKQLLRYKHIDELPWGSIPERRKLVFLGGLVVLERIFDALEIESMTVADYSLREGLLYDTIGQWSGEDARQRSVNQLTRQYDIDKQQAGRMHKVSMRLIKQVGKAWDLRTAQSKRLLQWSSKLHEIGLGIAHSHYHRHGAYVIRNADLPGFSMLWQQCLAWLIGGHRGRIPPLPPLAEDSIWAERLPRLLALLRISAVIVRSRKASDVPKFEAIANTNHLQLVLPEGWLKDHPLTRYGLAAEVTKLQELGVKFQFK